MGYGLDKVRARRAILAGMSYIVAHCRKVQTAVGLAAVGRHNCREAVYDAQGRTLGKLPDYIVNPERHLLNEGDRCGGKAILKRRSDRILEAELARKPQKNAAAAIEVSISASPDWFTARNPTQAQAYFKDCRKFLAEKYGKANILHWATHFDEKTPHMHVLIVPIIEGARGLKYSSSEFLGGRQGLRDLQGEIAAEVGAKYGLERGIEGSRARHTDQYEWMADTANVREKLAQKEAELAKKEADLAKQREEFERASVVKIAPFVPEFIKKPKLASIMVFPLSDDTEAKGWELYVAKETAIQAEAYTKEVLKVARAAQTKASLYEKQATKELPQTERLLAAMTANRDKIIDQFEDLTPIQLRSLANKREAELDQEKTRRRGIER